MRVSCRYTDVLFNNYTTSFVSTGVHPSQVSKHVVETAEKTYVSVLVVVMIFQFIQIIPDAEKISPTESQ